ncbi:rCG63401 [Rattus norvegicus]|uniref:RCG63401 n=1 Tax=Rattus norvegicus TaxID=10116 RepID=A6IHV1_RAT|nr:rCG63401 [Rattus norvegicus]
MLKHFNFLNPISDEGTRIEKLIYHTLIKGGCSLYTQ